MKLKISGKDLIKIGCPSDNTLNVALGTITRHFKKTNKATVLAIIEKIICKPEEYVNDVIWGRLAEQLLTPDKVKQHSLLSHRVPFQIFGENEIEEEAKNQLYSALKLPIAVKGALMPDAHGGYGLPIGGVLACRNAVIPYGVGVDIGCRMSLSIFNLPASYFKGREDQLLSILDHNTKFGMSDTHKIKGDHEVLDRSEFREWPLLKQLHEKAWKQIGTSGGGNHFVEMGYVDLNQEVNGVALGQYFALLSHSGSRSLGANISKHYTKIAAQLCPLPKHVQHLAWLDLDTFEGHAYWTAMTLAGDYAQACHDDIHRRISKALGIKPLINVANHHNFAWKEKHENEEMIVHRKGATPAHRDTLGLIPGSMIHPGYLVKGRGNSDSLTSAAHGAGRVWSRAKCKQEITASALKKVLSDHNVSLIGGGVDEAPMAYKNIDKVMALQTELVDVVGRFFPKLVKMDK